MPTSSRSSRPLVFAMTVCSIALGLMGCVQKPFTENVPPPSFDQGAVVPPDMHHAQNALDWAGTYQAVLPCQDCPGTAISVQLRPDMTATVRERRLGTPADQGTPQTYQGPFSFGEAPNANLISLTPVNEQVPAYRFFVSEGWIELRERATGAPLSQNSLYRLRQINLQ
jgi:hypothetical protein